MKFPKFIEEMSMPKKIGILAGVVAAIILFTVLGITSHNIKLAYVELSDGTYAVREYHTNAITAANAKLSDTYRGKPVTQIAENGFASGTIKEIEIPSSIKKIGKNAFIGCSNLTEIVIPDSVTEIGDSAFESCTGLTKITLSKNIKVIGSGAFYGCTNLTEIVIPEGVISIGEEAFARCSLLSTITLPSSLKYIYNSAFERCPALKSISIPANVTEIGKKAFFGCTGLESVSIPANVTEIADETFSGCTSLESVTLNEKLTKIGAKAFNGCSKLKNVTIPASVSRINSNSFAGTSAMEGILVAEGNANFQSHDGVLYSITVKEVDGASTTTVTLFHCPTAKKSLEIRADVNVIRENALKDCTSLATITFLGTAEAWEAVEKNLTAGNQILENVTCAG